MDLAPPVLSGGWRMFMPPHHPGSLRLSLSFLRLRLTLPAVALTLLGACSAGAPPTSPVLGQSDFTSAPPAGQTGGGGGGLSAAFGAASNSTSTSGASAP